MLSRFKPLAAAALLLILTAACTIAFCIYREYHRGAIPPFTAAAHIEVYLFRETQRSNWTLEMIGPVGSNQSYDHLDPLRSARLFTLEQQPFGAPRPWRIDSRIGPYVAGKRAFNPTNPGAVFARAELADAIRSGQLPWPGALADADSCREWFPKNLLLNALERSANFLWILLVPLALGAFAAVRILRAPKPGHCPACTYDLRGLPPSSPCPECGT